MNVVDPVGGSRAIGNGSVGTIRAHQVQQPNDQEDGCNASFGDGEVVACNGNTLHKVRKDGAVGSSSDNELDEVASCSSRDGAHPEEHRDNDDETPPSVAEGAVAEEAVDEKNALGVGCEQQMELKGVGLQRAPAQPGHSLGVVVADISRDVSDGDEGQDGHERDVGMPELVVGHALR